MSLDRPIFIVGTGRCGSTAFHNVFTMHPQVAFLSGLCLLHPKKPQYNRLAMRLMDIPLARRYARKKFRPAEHWPFWDHYVRGFSAPCRDLVADDVRPNEMARITLVFEEMLTPRRRRLLVKLTGWPRLGFLSEMFPGALFIHIIRDGRAVANSLMNVDFWQGWGGPQRMGLGELKAEELEEWKRSDCSFTVLAAVFWKRLMDSFEVAKRDIPPSQYMEVLYRDIVADPVAKFAEVLSFCDLGSPPEFLDEVRHFQWRNANDKWEQQLTAKQQALLNASLKEHLVRYGDIQRSEDEELAGRQTSASVGSEMSRLCSVSARA